MKTIRLSSILRRFLLLTAVLLLVTASAAAFDSSEDSGLLMLVNKSHAVSSEYVPKTVKLQNINSVSNDMKMRPEVAEAFTQMYADMMADGVSTCHVISGYRSYEYQKYLVDTKVAKRVANGMHREKAYNQVTMSTAPAGCSEHQLGLALDLSTSTYSSQSFADSDAGQWMAKHAWKYGFIRRYQSDKASMTGIVNEAWHYRYVGVPHAQIMVENNWCLEEYLDYLQQNGSYTLVTDDASYGIYWTQDEAAEYRDVIDLSRDNNGGWIITTKTAADPLRNVYGHWSESAFLALQKRGISPTKVIVPNQAVTFAEFAHLCGLDTPANGRGTMKREDAAVLLAATLPNQTLAYLTYSDLDHLSGRCFQSVQIAVSNGIFSHGEKIAFRPTEELTWGEAAAIALRYWERIEEAAAQSV